MRALTLHAFQGADGLRLAEAAAPEAGERILIQVHAAGVGFADLLVTQGRYQVRPALPFIPGMAVAGVVLNAPAGAGLRPGARVAGFCGLGGGFAEVVAAPAATTFELPARVDFADAVGLPVDHQSAYFALHRRARLRAGETVVVHGAGGGIGTAAVQVAKALDARVIAVTGSPQRRRAAALAGADDLVTAEPGWVDEVRRCAGGRGVDVVLDPVGGDRCQESLRALAPEGRLVVVGFTGGQIAELRTNRLLLRNVTVLGAAWREFITDVEPEFPARAAAVLTDMIAAGRLVPTSGAHYPLAQGARALRALAARRTVGRVALIMDRLN